MNETTVIRIVRVVGANKALAAGLSTFLAGLAGIVVHWGVTGALNAEEFRLLAADAGAALIAAAATYITPAREALVEQRELAAVIAPDVPPIIP